MLNETGFDLWADGYDKSVGLSDDDGRYPFAGYRALMNAVYRRILAQKAESVLDIGFGTAVLTERLYAHGCKIYGQDFSARMCAIAQEKMPDAKLFQGDFSRGLVPPLRAQAYDAIVATYSLHHLTDAQKVEFLRALLPLLSDKGCIYVGDVAFQTRAELAACRADVGEEWDEDERYFVFDELQKAFPKLRFAPFSHCAGLMTLSR